MKKWWMEKKNRVMKNMVSEFGDRRKQFVGMVMLVGIICLSYGIVNTIEGIPTLTYSLCVFGLLDMVLSAFYYRFTSLYKIVRIWLILSIWLEEFILLITGGAEGVGPLWLLLIPAFAPCTLGLQISTVICLGMFVQSIFLFYMDSGMQFVRYSGYTDSFRARYPVVIFLFFIMGAFLEIVREATFRKMQRLNEQLTYLSTHDPLTGTYNRNGFNRKMDACVMNQQTEQNFCLLISDLDFFKRVNDTYGHDVGDQVLCITAKRMEEALGNVDAVVCRWGGEEFAILIQNRSLEESRQLAEKIRKMVQEPFQIENGTNLHISVSMGGIHSCHRQNKIAEYVNKADEMLYYSKEHGRNQVTFYSDKRVENEIA